MSVILAGCMGANLTSVKAQSPDWIAMGQLRPHGVGFETD